ncbi:MAG: DUF167 domain-containing protein [Burkholderiales bacterium]|nr:DUF167 domain-containing protein [Burkholderiales bacterium]
MSGWARRSAGGWVLAVHVQPGAKSNAVAGLHGDALKVRVAAPPAAGRANAALEAFLAERLGVARSSVRVARGGSSRAKQVVVSDAGADPHRLLAD